jgi:hypothetical protein
VQPCSDSLIEHGCAYYYMVAPIKSFLRIWTWFGSNPCGILEELLDRQELIEIIYFMLSLVKLRR